jgi:hypothetical protein
VKFTLASSNGEHVQVHVIPLCLAPFTPSQRLKNVGSTKKEISEQRTKNVGSTMAIRKISAHKSSIRKRHLALRSQQLARSTYLKSCSLLLLIQCVRLRNNPNARLIGLTRLVILSYYKVAYNSNIQWNLPSPLRWHTSFDSFSSDVCYNFFRIEKHHLQRYFAALRFDERCTTKNRLTFSGEEIMLRGYYEMVSGEDQFSIATNIFGRDQAAQSQALSYFVDHLYDTFSDLLLNNLDWWEEHGFMEQSRKAIIRKLAVHGLVVPECRISAFIDCNCLETAVPGAGPIGQGGPAALRWDDNVQRAFYNGWKSMHGLKHQTRENAFGMCEDLYGTKHSLFFPY